MSNKSWIVLAIAYFAFCALITVIEGPGIHHEPLSTRLDKLLVVPMWWGFMVHDIQYGEVRGRFSRVDRTESPITFWVNIAVYFLLGIFFFWWAI